MGEVYRARDAALDRDVALKVLPEAVAGDEERMARFRREAQVLASLDHPNIGAIYGIEESGETPALVLELVDGPTLEERLAAGALPVDDALETALQIATALEAAHEAGVVHRDLKPANVKVADRPDGRRVKVLDFGLAKSFETGAASGSQANSPTLSLAATQAGVILGTAAYMSPEQARGVGADKRADVWSFGVVLFEMLSGQQLFGGDTVSDTLADVLRAELDWRGLPADTPASVRWLLHRCLQRDPRKRLRDIGEARIVLAAAVAGEDAGGAGASPVPWSADPVAGTSHTTQRSAGARSALRVAAIAVLVLATFAAGRYFGADEPPRDVIKLGFGVSGLDALAPAISPDGRRVAYSAGGGLYVRDLGHSKPVLILPDVDARHLFWAPDSESIAVLGGQRIWRVGADGGARAEVARLPEAVVGGAGGVWTPDGRIVFTQGNTGFFAVSARGGDPGLILEATAASSGDHFHEPSMLPGGELVFVFHAANATADTLLVSTGDGYREILTIGGERLVQPRYAPSGHIVFQRTGSLPGIWAVPYSVEDGQTTGEPFLVVPNGGVPSVADDGTLAHAAGMAQAVSQLVWVGRDGNVEEVIVDASVSVGNLALSPDGTRIVYSHAPGGVRDLYVHDVERSTTSRLTFTPEEEWKPAWFPDGRRLVFTKNVDGVMQVTRIDTIDAADQRTIAAGGNAHVSPDSEYVVYTTASATADANIWYVEADGSADPQLFVDAPGLQDHPVFSPDGRWVAYESNEGGTTQVYLTDFPAGETRFQVSVDSGAWPQWARSGDRLFFLNGEAILEVEVEYEGDQIRLGTPGILFDGGPRGLHASNTYDVDVDGDRFVMPAVPAGQVEHREISLLFNWIEELR